MQKSPIGDMQVTSPGAATLPVDDRPEARLLGSDEDQVAQAETGAAGG